MKAEEIRKMSPYSGVLSTKLNETFVPAMLQEIAAQLAELNHRTERLLSVITAKVASNGN